jgi:raffinose/stachyose/melibiose transport system permease protein
VTVFRDTSFWHAFLITCLYAIASIICVNVPAFFIAYLLKEKFKGVTLFRASFFLPNLIGGVVLGYIWSMLFDGILSRFGTYLTASPVFGFWGLVILVAWQQIGYMMIIYIAGFTALPEEMLEASQMDGANRFQRMTKIIIPNMKASIAICTFLTLTNSFKMFDQNLALTGGQPIRTLENGMQLKTTELLAMNIYSTYQINNHWHGTAQAKAVIFFLLVAAFGALQLYATREKKEKVKKNNSKGKKA